MNQNNCRQFIGPISNRFRKLTIAVWMRINPHVEKRRRQFMGPFSGVGVNGRGRGYFGQDCFQRGRFRFQAAQQHFEVGGAAGRVGQRDVAGDGFQPIR